ncbi:helix-turn-helix transcriptional regulator [Cohnella fermenti]|nr:AraC family transcriptional regulator [Cohnella fermenti]
MFVQRLEFSFAFSHRPGTAVPFHRHDCFELVYYLEGAGDGVIDNTSYSYSANTFSLIRPAVYHNESHREETDLVCIGFLAHEYPDLSRLLANGTYADPSCQLLPIVSKMKRELLNRSLRFQWKLELLLNEFLIEFERTRTQQFISSSFDYIENYIHENFNQDIHLPSLARMSGYSYDHFRHLFKLKTGESPWNYIISKRIEHAKKLMLSTDLSMSSLCQECGFTSSSQFSGTFRKLTGLTPTEFKRKNFIL